MKRVAKLGIDFSDKVILDIGCNQGGMIFAMNQAAHFCYGLDANAGLINVCHKLRQIMNIPNVNFFTMDLEKEPLQHIGDLLEHEVDICMLMSICNWINNWKEVVGYCHLLAPILVLETNGDRARQLEQMEFVRELYRQVNVVSQQSLDDKFERRRCCVVCLR